MISELLELRRMMRARFWSADALHAAQSARLRAVVRHAYERVPYYRARMRSIGLDPRDIRGVGDVALLPITTKADLLAAEPHAALTEGVDPAACIRNSTSGWSGVPLTVYRSHAEYTARRLGDFRALLSAGMRPRDRLAVLGPQHHRKRALHERFGVFRTVTIGTTEAPERKLAALRRLRPTMLWAYPTPLLALVEHSPHVLEMPGLRALITSAETFEPFARERILHGVSLETFNFYGSHELGRVAYECGAHDGLHVAADHVLVEVLDGDRDAAPGRPGDVVATNLVATTMPFLRYRIGDVVAWRGRACACGSNFPKLDAPQGRKSDLVRLPSGASVAALGIGFIVREHSIVRRFRAIQKALDHVVVLVVADGTARERETTTALIRERLLDYFREPVRIDVQVVDAIPDTRQKFSTFVSEIDPAP